MKKYMKPAIKARAINTESVIASSPTVEGADINTTDNTLPTEAGKTGGQAKRFDIWN